MAYYVYFLSNDANGTLYIGMTNNLIRRIYEHKEGLIEGFSQKYNLKKLIYFEIFETAYEAITREKQLKTWKRDWKIALIMKDNPYWHDLYETLL